MPTIVVNINNEPYDVYIGRAGHGQAGTFGNPYKAGGICRRCKRLHVTGTETLACFEDYFTDRVLKDADFREQVRTLKGKRLGCFCKPGPCHGDVIARLLDNNKV